MSTFEEHLKVPVALKSYVIDRNGMAVLVEVLEVKIHDNSRQRKLCNAKRNDCRQVSDWMALKVNGTAMFLHTQEVKRLEFDNGATLLLSAATIHDRSAKEGSALCWD